MSSYSAYKAYNNAATTVSKTKQVIMLYDGMIRFIHQAKEAIKEGNIEYRYDLIAKTLEIIAGLQTSLDFEHGGNIAKTLYDFYNNIEMKLMELQRSNKFSLCDDLMNELKIMRDSWSEIDNLEIIIPQNSRITDNITA